MVCFNCHNITYIDSKDKFAFIVILFTVHRIVLLDTSDFICLNIKFLCQLNSINLHWTEGVVILLTVDCLLGTKINCLKTSSNSLAGTGALLKASSKKCFELLLLHNGLITLSCPLSNLVL